MIWDRRDYWPTLRFYAYDPFGLSSRMDGRRGQAGRMGGTPGVRDDGRGGGRYTKRYADGRNRKRN
jgi:hypothetical protein